MTFVSAGMCLLVHRKSNESMASSSCLVADISGRLRFQCCPRLLRSFSPVAMDFGDVVTDVGGARRGSEPRSMFQSERQMRLCEATMGMPSWLSLGVRDFGLFRAGLGVRSLWHVRLSGRRLRGQAPESGETIAIERSMYFLIY